ncbi:MAG: hypothetical protein AAF989_11520, partial [Planctomycetota bacterium]
MSNETFKLPDGTRVGTGNIAPEGGPTQMLRAFPDELMLEDSEIMKLLKRRQLKKMRAKRRKRMQAQGTVGSCNARMAVGMRYQCEEISGAPHKVLAPEHLYMNINGGRDSGSMLDKGMKRMGSGGCAEYGMVPYQSFNRRQVKDIGAADQNGRQYEIHEPYALPSD